MRHLKEFMLESSSQENDIRKSIADYVSNKDNVIHISNLIKAKNILQQLSDDEYDQLKENYKNNRNGMDLLFDLLNKRDNKLVFLRELAKKNNPDSPFPTFNDLEKNSNLFDVIMNNNDICNMFTDKIEMRKFLEDLMQMKYKDAGDKGVGRGELYLFTMFKSTKTGGKTTGDTKDSVKGDVQVGGKNIEVKFSTSNSANGGRVMASNLHLKSPNDLAKFLIEELGKIDDDISISIGGPNVISELLKTLETSFELSKEDAFKKIAKMYLYQFPWYEAKLDDFEKFIDSIYANDINAANELIRIHGCLALMEYCDSDKWDYLLVGNTQTGKYYLINGTNCKLDRFLTNLKTLYDDTGFIFKDGPSNSSGANIRNYVSTIYVNSND